MNLGRHLGSRRLATRLAACLVPLGLALALAASVSASMPPPEPTAPAGTPADETQDESPQAAAPVEFVQSWTLTPGGGPDGAQAGSRPNLSYQLAPGTSVDDIVVVYNLGNTPLDLRVYATDAFNNDDGDFDLLPGDELPSDVGSWVLLATDRVTLAPGTQATIPIRITVPPDASPGDHVGAVLASSVSTFDNGDGTVVDVDRRTGTRLYIQVDGPLNPQLAVGSL
ncbi:MAG: WxL protein peptidoglycan domain-containing protein, partial [Actinomycetes bacterium]